MKKTQGFTLVEMIVVVTIISILSSVGVISYFKAVQRARDDDRKADLKTLQVAIELYKQRYGRYPVSCRGVGVWSGQIGTSYACPGGSSQYIVGLAPAFIPTLPQEKKLNGTDSGYVYATNAAGTVYKIEAKKTVESEIITYNHPMKSCEATDSSTGYCDDVYSLGNIKPNWCQESDNATFQISYALWGGYDNAVNQTFVERGTEDIICAIQ